MATGISKPTAEDRSLIITASGVIADGPVEISAMTLIAAANAATAIIDDSEDGAGTAKWVLSAAIGTSESISFPKPIPFAVGAYGTLSGTGMKLAVALTNS